MPKYTDAPPLRQNPLIGSLQLLFWLFFHPTAWCNHVSRIAPNLPPDFCLAQVQFNHLKNKRVWQLLVLSYLTWPFLAAGLIAGGLWWVEMDIGNILFGALVGTIVGLVVSVAVSLVGSLAVGLTSGIAVALVVGILGTWSINQLGSFIPNVAISQFELTVSTVVGVASGLAGGLSFGVAMGLIAGMSAWSKAGLTARQLSGIVVGLLIGGLAGRLAGEAENGRYLTSLIIGLPFGVAIWLRTRSWKRGLVAGIGVGLVGGLANQLEATASINQVETIALVIVISSFFALPYVLAERVAGASAGALAGALGSGGGFFLFVVREPVFVPAILIFVGVGLLLGLVLVWWRPVLSYPFLLMWNLLLGRVDEWRLANGRSSLFHRHSAFWDEFQRLPLYNLEQHLLMVLKHEPELGQKAMAYLSTSHQWQAAQAVQIELDAQMLEACQTVETIAHSHLQLAAGELEGPASALLRSFSRISQDVAVAHTQESAYNRRLSLSAVEDRLDGLLRELTRSHEPYAMRFRAVVAAWRQVIAQAVQRSADEAELRQEIDSPYIIGIPLTDRQEIFVGRTHISARIEQLLLDKRQPPLLLYGQRRVGKTSLLNNLGRLLPSHITPLFVDLQGPASRSTDDAGFLYNMGRSMIRSARQMRGVVLPRLERASLEADPYTRFDEWLDEIEWALGQGTALLMLDEFEVLAGVLANGRLLEENILGMLRNLIQHRPRFKVLLSGSHTLEGFQAWASYLINVQVVHIGHLTQEETRQLVEQPTREFALRYEPSASERVWELTQGHPFLVQLLCAEVVAIKNEHPPHERRLATVQDVETAVAPALAHGNFFFVDIEQNQVSEAGVRLLRFLAQRGEQSFTTLSELQGLVDVPNQLHLLQQRELIQPQGAGYTFSVELVRRWFGGEGGN